MNDAVAQIVLPAELGNSAPGTQALAGEDSTPGLGEDNVIPFNNGVSPIARP